MLLFLKKVEFLKQEKPQTLSLSDIFGNINAFFQLFHCNIPLKGGFPTITNLSIVLNKYLKCYNGPKSSCDQ